MESKVKEPQEGQQNLAMSLNLDTTPILYTDNVFMVINEDGVVLDFGQKMGTSNQIRIVARLGMSREHANKFVQLLGQLIIKSEGQIQTGKGGAVN